MSRKDAQGDFFRQINKVPFPESNKMPYFTGASGRIHGMTASGKFLCAHKPGSICRDCDPQQALKGWNDLPESERKPCEDCLRTIASENGGQFKVVLTSDPTQ